MKSYEVVGFPSYSYGKYHTCIVKARNKKIAEKIGKIIVSSKWECPNPKIAVKELFTSKMKKHIYEGWVWCGDFDIKRYITADNEQGAKRQLEEIASRVSPGVKTSGFRYKIFKPTVYEEDILTNAGCKDIDKVVVFWIKNGNPIKEIFNTIEDFEEYAKDYGLCYNCESTEILKDNLLCGLIYRQWKFIDFEDIEHKFKSYNIY